MKLPYSLVLAAAALLVATAAAAQSSSQSLDLNLPAGGKVAAAAPAAGGADEPGKYYGDVDGDGSQTHVSGSFSTTVGYAKGFGTGIGNSASLNVSKTYDDGREVDLHIHVSHSDGLPGYGWGGYGYYPRYRGF